MSAPYPVTTFGYVNYRGERSERRVHAKSIRFGSSEWHHEPQWLMFAFDIDKGENRSFAMKDMTDVRVAHETDMSLYFEGEMP